MSQAIWDAALKLLESGNMQAGLETLQSGMNDASNDPRFLFVYGRFLIAADKYADAAPVLRQSVAGDSGNVEARYALAYASKRLGHHNGVAEARDILLDIISKQPVHVSVLREAAECCNGIGPMEKAAELWSAVATQSNDPVAYFKLSEMLADLERLPEATEALRMAVSLDPERYKKNLEDLVTIEQARSTQKPGTTRKRGRYPDTEVLQGNLRTAIMEHIAIDCEDAPKFIQPNTSFFTMGSCFARNIVRALVAEGYNARNLEISENVNTSYGNRYFVDWLEGSRSDGQVAERIEELLGYRGNPNVAREALFEQVTKSDVFILTLGVAPCFFDRGTGEFVMPRPTNLNSRALAEKYTFRTTSVAENVENVTYIASFVRKYNPSAKIVLTVSPVPLHATFEFKSAIVADCVSKSTMRVAAHEVVHNAGLKDIYYWPSFEVFRWLGSHTGPVYGSDDGASWHPDEPIIQEVINCFIEMFKAPE
jgi:tetratricopeptide (TPR) repeat protein